MKNCPFVRPTYRESAPRSRIALLCTIAFYLLIVAPAVAEDQFFDSDGVKLRYIDQGPRDGDPVVLLHGFSQRIETAWVDSGVIDALDNTYRVIALDWRGHGKSDTPHDPAMYGDAVADDVVRLLDHLEIDKSHIVGYSMGGQITFRLLADHPERILSAIPCSIAGANIPDEYPEVSARTVASLRTSGSIRPLVDYFAAPGSVSEEQARQIVASQRSSNDVAALVAVMLSFRALDADPARLAANAIPCLAIIGEHDPFLPGLQITARNMPNLEVEVIKGHDHISLLRAPEFMVAVSRFLGGQSTAGDRFFDSAGVKIRYVDRGPRDAEPIVLLPGAAVSIEEAWGVTGVLDALSDDHRVIAIDPRGQGKSDKPHDRAAYGQPYVDDVIRLLDHLGIDRTHAVGYSLGGRILGKLLVDHPERLISALPCGTVLEPSAAAEREEFEQFAKALEERGDVRPLINRFNTDGAMTEAQLDEIAENFRVTKDTKAVAMSLRSMDDILPDRAKLEANPVPCLSIVGEGDPNLAVTRTTATYMANLEIHVIEGATHLTAYGHPAFVEAIKAFVAKHSADDAR